MGGFLAIFERNGRTAEPARLDAALEALTHRGARVERRLAGPIAFGGRSRLSSVGAEAADGRLLVGDLRLDDRSALATRVGLGPDATDAELILAAHAKWGEQCPDALLGDFAFAIWSPDRERLFVARDPMGVKPFYYVLDAERFAASTELPVLLAAGVAPADLDEARVAEFLAMVYENKERTFYRAIRRLAPGHAMTVTRDGVVRARYWAPDPSYALDGLSDEESVERFLETFDRAVLDRVAGDVSVGSTLSGGLDSSSIAVTATRYRGTIPTFSAVFPSLPPAELARIDERPYMDSVVAAAPLAPHAVACDEYSPLGVVDDLLRHLGQPFFGPNLYMHWELYRTARASGVDALLDGIDGDTTISHGLEYLSDLFVTGRFVRLWQTARALARTRPSDRLGPWTIIWRLAVLGNLPDALHARWRRLRGYPQEDWLASSGISLDLARRTGLLSRRGRFDGQTEMSHGTARQRHAGVLESAVVTDVLELADGAAGAFGLEPRYPFFDRRLIELCLALPVEQKLKDGWTRSILRRAMADRLPDDVRWRFLKTNLSPNFLRQTRERDLDTIQQVFREPPQLLAEFVDLDALRLDLRRYIESDGHEGDPYRLHRITVFGKWLSSLNSAARK